MKKPLLSEMTLREKIGQMLLPCQHDIYCREEGKAKEVFRERTDFTNLRSEQEIKDYLKKENFGTFCFEQTDFFKAVHPSSCSSDGQKVNVAAYREFMQKQDAYGNIPALMSGSFATDSVSSSFEGMTVVCPPLAVGAANSEALAYEQGAAVAKEMRSVGANWLWGPVVDICHKFSATLMKTFSPDDPDRLVRLAKAYIKGIQENGVAATARHFPGGDRYDYRDPDVSPTVISSDMDEWWKEQGKVLKEVIGSGVYSVMVNHTAFPAVDDSLIKGRFRPATVSKKIVTDLLKQELGFAGVVVTENIATPSLITCFDSPDEMIVALVNAGNDVLTGVFPAAGEVIEKAVKDGIIAEERIDDACQRILDMKEKLGLFGENEQPLAYRACTAVSETKKVNEKIAKKAITLVRDTQDLLPVVLSDVKTATIVCCAHTETFFEKLQYMKKLMEDRGVKVKLQRRIDEPIDMERVDKESDLIIYVVYVAENLPKGHPGLYGVECAGLQFALSSGQKKSLAISMGYPYIHYDILGNAETFINAYGCTEELMEACVEAIFGEIEMKGVSPVKIEPDQVWY